MPIWEINTSWDLSGALPHKIPLGVDRNLQNWGVHLHTSLMARLLQITHDTSSDDIFKTAFLLNGIYATPSPLLAIYTQPPSTL